MQNRVGFFRLSVVAALLACMAGCTVNSRLEGTSAGTTLHIRGYEGSELPRSERLDSKATGQHEFMAADDSGERLYGILPLRVSAGKMTASILFFAPALFIGGFRDVFKHYQADVAEGVIRYKSADADPWLDYCPTAAESERARTYFETRPTSDH